MELIGYVVGNTRTGKSVYSNGSVFPIATSLEELFDAYAIFQYLCFREYVREKTSERFDLFLVNVESFKDQIGVEELARVRAKHQIKTAFDLRDYGRQLVLPEFVNIDRS